LHNPPQHRSALLAPTDDNPVPDHPAPRGVGIGDLYRFRLLSDPQLSPDGRTLAYVQTRLRKKQNDYASNIWLVPADGSREPVRFTTGDKRDMTPRWSPKGDQLAFISTRSGKPQLWIIPLAGGEARRLTRAKRGVGEFAWSSDGRWIAFTSAVDNELDKKFAAEAAQAAGKSAPGQSPDSENREPGSLAPADLGPPVSVATEPGPGEWDEDAEDEEAPEAKGDHAKLFTRLHFKADGEGLVERRKHLF